MRSSAERALSSELNRMLREAERQGEAELVVDAAELGPVTGGGLDSRRRLLIESRRIMQAAMVADDHVIDTPPNSTGHGFVVRYRLPRR